MRKVLVIGDDSYIGCKIKAWLDAFPSEYDVDIISSRENKWKEADYTKYGTVVNTAGIAHINLCFMPLIVTYRLILEKFAKRMV